MARSVVKSAEKMWTSSGKKEHVATEALDAFPWEEASNEFQLATMDSDSESEMSESSRLASIPEETLWETLAERGGRDTFVRL